MERVDINHDGVVPTASTLARFFNGLPSMAYPIRLMTYDLHTLQNSFYLTGHTVALLHTATPLMRNVIIGLKSSTRSIDALAFPDAGAHKRFAKLFQEEIPENKTIICEKIRDGDNRIVTVVQGNDLMGEKEIKHVLIVDDMINSGGTLIECANKLISKGGPDLKVSVYVTHAIFNDVFFESVQSNKFQLFETIYMTDSIPNEIQEIISGFIPKPKTQIKIPREANAGIIHRFDDTKIKSKFYPLLRKSFPIFNTHISV